MLPDAGKPQMPDWDRLTSLASKGRLYEIDSYFIEGFGDLRERLGGRLYNCVERHAFVLFKPEAVRSRKIFSSFEYFRGHSFIPRSGKRLPLRSSDNTFDMAVPARASHVRRVRLYSRWVTLSPHSWWHSGYSHRSPSCSQAFACKAVRVMPFPNGAVPVIFARNCKVRTH